ncbi:putative Puff-specific protein Bx42 [Planoprotostelium fungivorum]|uniref:Putative Puff-specific protein Bx42 n=1 Tax=Planoprotostelium fungivorum TaxID=1890364 RepID=A0A2P6NB52_9EUKA|nr:putative Puff-specific protein Bx42 [Planoprotostelium fungivorum]
MATRGLPLPAPRHSAPVTKTQSQPSRPTSNALTLQSSIPPYGKRKGWIPRLTEDFGEGGAFPEIHVAQYPLEMGRKSSANSKTVPITLDNQGRIKYETLLAPGSSREIQARHEDLAAKKIGDEEMRRPDQDEINQTTLETKQALEKIVNGRIAGQAAGAGGKTGEAKFIQYTPIQNQATKGVHNSGAEKRIIRLTEAAVDPLEPSKHLLNKKVPKGPPSPPVPVMHSPPRKVTAKDQQDWKIPPMISNWKNNKGYTVSLDKRLVADGRGLQDYTPSDGFAKLSESLYEAERTAREEVMRRAEIDRRLKLHEKDRKEQEFREMAQEARIDRIANQADEDSGLSREDIDARQERETMRRDRTRERERDLRMGRNRSAASRNADRDVGEKMALGLSVPTASSEAKFDQRLFNQSQGMDSGFGADEEYNIYSKQLFGGSSANVLYRPKPKGDEEYGGEEDLKKLQDTSKFRPDKGFAGSERDPSKPNESRNTPVQFEKSASAAHDPFSTELDAFLTEAKRDKTKGGDRAGSGGAMHANAGNSNSRSLSEGGGSKRNRIDFDDESSSRKKR